MKPTFNPTDISKVKEQLSSSRKVTLISHIAPDGDAVGSTLAMARLLSLQGHETRVVYPTFFPESFNVLEGGEETIIAKRDLQQAKDALEWAELIFCLDFNEPKRVEALEEALLASSAFKVLIDHHLHPAAFVDVTFSYPPISSTCLLLYHFIDEMGWGHLIDREVAECIYWGMMTDTGCFSFNSEDPYIYTTISALLDKGIRKDYLTAEVTRSYSIDKIKLNAHAVMNNMTVLPEYKTAIITLTNKEKLQYNYRVGDTEGLVNVPLEAKEIEFSIFVYEVNKQSKISLRSKGDFPTNVFAKRFFNGGGHKNASGAEVFDTLPNTVNMVLEALKVMHP